MDSFWSSPVNGNKKAWEYTSTVYSITQMALGFPSLFLSRTEWWVNLWLKTESKYFYIGNCIDTAISKLPVLLSYALTGKSQESNTGKIEDSCSVGG